MHVYRRAVASTLLLALSACTTGASEHQQQALTAEHSLLDATQFYVCGSAVAGMDGKYVLQQNSRTQSDPDTPVFFREDDDDDDDDVSASALAAAAQQQHDMRLFRHNGFWMFADVSAWPPATHYRCDPTKRHLVPRTLDLMHVCGPDQPTPPSAGYTPARSEHAASRLVLSQRPCQGSARTASGENGSTTTLASLARSSRVSEL